MCLCVRVCEGPWENNKMNGDEGAVREKNHDIRTNTHTRTHAWAPGHGKWIKYFVKSCFSLPLCFYEVTQAKQIEHITSSSSDEHCSTFSKMISSRKKTTRETPQTHIYTHQPIAIPGRNWNKRAPKWMRIDTEVRALEGDTSLNEHRFVSLSPATFNFICKRCRVSAMRARLCFFFAHFIWFIVINRLKS